MKTNKGNVIQITNKDHHWYPCLLVVSEVKQFGCVAYLNFPISPTEIAKAPIRLREEDYENIGIAVIVEDDSK